MLLDLFLCFVQVGLFSIGGGYAAMPMIQAKAVEYYHWLTMSEFTDLMTIAEMTPGPITVNSATFVGIRMAGIPGALVATMGCILPSLIIVSLLSWLYEKYRSMDAMQAVLACLRPGGRGADCLRGADDSAGCGLRGRRYQREHGTGTLCRAVLSLRWLC